MHNSGAISIPTGRVKNTIPFFIAALASGVYLLWLLWEIFDKTGGFYPYPMDDTYIHMQIGRNLAFHGTWGIQPGVFESASSSLFYPLLLAAAFRIFGAHNSIPFLLNVMAGIILLFVVNKWLLKQSVSLWARTLILLLGSFLMPLPVMISTGMEHCFQTLTVFLFLTALSDYLDRPGTTAAGKPPLKLWIYAVLVTGIRFEGLFVIAAATLILLWQQKIRAGIMLVISGWLPVILFGVYSLSKGSYFFPNSVVLKSFLPVSVHDLPFYFRLVFNHFMLGPMDDFPGQMSFLAAERLLIVLPLLYLVLHRTKSAVNGFPFLIPALFFCTLLHLLFAATGWFFRYEAYLIFCSAIIVPASLCKMNPGQYRAEGTLPKLLASILLVFLAAPAFTRAGEAFVKNKISCINIFEQQCQSARFVRQFYDHSSIALVDIGAISFFTDAEITDLIGLGNIDVTRHWKEKTWTGDYLAGLMKNKKVSLAIVPRHFRDDVFSRWTLVGSMEISNNFSCASPQVNFYIPDIKDKAAMQSNLRHFQRDAPRSIFFNFY